MAAGDGAGLERPVGRWGRWGWGARRGAGVSEGEGAVVVGDAEVGEAHEVDGGGSGGEPEVVGGDAAVGDASGFVAGEPRDGAFGHGAVLLVGAWVAGWAQRCGCRKLCRWWSGGISVLVDESATAGRFHDLEVSIWLVCSVGGDRWSLIE